MIAYQQRLLVRVIVGFIAVHKSAWHSSAAESAAATASAVTVSCAVGLAAISRVVGQHAWRSAAGIGECLAAAATAGVVVAQMLCRAAVAAE
jgi:hypothetical protein